MNALSIGLAGAGTVGGGVVKVLRDKVEFFRGKLGLPIRLKRVVDKRAERFSELGIGADVLTTDDAADILNDDEIRIVVELIGGTTYARQFVLDALRRGKHVVTANKALLAEHGPEIFQTATDHDVSVYFEASVGGGMPVIKTLREGMIANDIRSLRTIINGTCNYILTQMSAKGLAFDVALAAAQNKGFAEADPTLDIGGFDAGHKVAILASLAYGGYLAYSDIPIQGIESITQEDIQFSRELGYTIKLLGIIKSSDGKLLDVRVHPAMVHADYILASVSDSYNAVLLDGDSVGQILLYGKGAGELPTASAVTADLVDCVRDILAPTPRRISMDFYSTSKRLSVLPLDSVRTRYYFRFSVLDRPGVLGAITTTFGNHGISIAAMTQKEDAAADYVPVIMVSHMAEERSVRAALAEIDAAEFVRAKTQMIRIEE
jgi:homoserine dehydrogenase